MCIFRSSTSSWCDEPVHNSMDISTGHMVLAYMEDHLKNKQRLEQEWVALCGYEAEPNSTVVAFKAENKKKNRYPDKLPYDHNRVILNALVNASSSDYINASTVVIILFFFFYARCLKLTEKISFNIASEASYVHILSGQKLIKNAKNVPFWRVFENLKLAVKQCYQTGQF